MQYVQNYLDVQVLKPGTVIETPKNERYIIIQLNTGLYTLVSMDTYRGCQPIIYNDLVSIEAALGQKIAVMNGNNERTYLPVGTVILGGKAKHLVVRKPNGKIGLMDLHDYLISSLFEEDLCITKGVTAEALIDYFSVCTYDTLQYCSFIEYMKMEDLK